MQDTPTRQKKPPEAHEEKYRNQPPVDRLPAKGDKRPTQRSPEDLTAGHIDEHRHRPGKDSKDES